MIVKNFFKEKIEINNKKSIEKEIEDKYGLPSSEQRIFNIENKFILSLESNNFVNQNNNEEIKTLIPEELESLGATQKDFEHFSSQSCDLEIIKKNLFPYLFENEKEKCIFNKFDRSNLEDYESFVNSIDERKGKLILKNLDDYIYCFFNNNYN